MRVDERPYGFGSFVFDLIAFPLLGPPWLVYAATKLTCIYISRRRSRRIARRVAAIARPEIAPTRIEAPQPEIPVILKPAKASKPKATRKRRRLTLERIEALAAAGELKGSQREIAKAIGKSPAAVNRALKRVRDSQLRLN